MNTQTIVIHKFIRRIVQSISLTPLHPQWFVFREQQVTLKIIKPFLKGKILDIGCADKYLEKLLDENSQYIGLDYLKTANEMYLTTPTIYGDAHNLSIADSTIDTVALLDVLEHLHTPKTCMQEIQRVLKPNGRLILQVPFLYPIHDAPYDFHRWTKYGLTQLLENHEFGIESTHTQGKISETFSLLTNIGLAKISLELVSITKLFIIVIPIISIIILFINIAGFLLGTIFRNSSFMPYGYLLICRKK